MNKEEYLDLGLRPAMPDRLQIATHLMAAMIRDYRLNFEDNARAALKAADTLIKLEQEAK